MYLIIEREVNLNSFQVRRRAYVMKHLVRANWSSFSDALMMWMAMLVALGEVVSNVVK